MHAVYFFRNFNFPYNGKIIKRRDNYVGNLVADEGLGSDCFTDLDHGAVTHGPSFLRTCVRIFYRHAYEEIFFKEE